MKKRFVLLLTLIIMGTVIFLTFNNYNNLTIESKIEKLLITAYTSDYNDYSNDNPHKELEKITDKKEQKVKSFFTENGFDFIKRIRFMMSSGLTSLRKKCSIKVNSVEIDLRETEDEDINVCYFTVLVSANYIDNHIKNKDIEITGTMSIYYEDEKWKIGIIIEDGYPFDDLNE